MYICTVRTSTALSRLSNPRHLLCQPIKSLPLRVPRLAPLYQLARERMSLAFHRDEFRIHLSRLQDVVLLPTDLEGDQSAEAAKACVSSEASAYPIESRSGSPCS